MKILILLVTLFISLNGVTQINLDSLWGVWNDPSQPDTNRLKAMGKISWDGYLFSQPDSAFYFAQLQYNFAKEKGEKQYMAEALGTQGVSFDVRGKYEEALNTYLKSLEIFKEIEDKKGIASCLMRIGVAYHRKGDIAKALDYHEQSLNIKEEIGDIQGIAKSLHNIALIYNQQGDYDKALDYYTQSLKIVEEIGDKRVMASSLNSIGNIYNQQGDYDKALDYYTQSLKILEEIGDKRVMASSLNNIGNIYLDQGDYDKAIDHNTQSLKIREEIGDKRGIAISLNSIGIIYKNQGDYDKAIDHYTQSLKIREEIGDKKGVANSLNNIGNIYYDQGDYDKALDYYTQSLKIVEEIGDKSGMANSLNNIGIIYRRQGDYDKAMDYNTRSLKIREEIGDKQGIANSLNSIGNIYYEQGDYDRALKYGSRSLLIAQEIGAVIQTKEAADLLWYTNKKLGKYKAALEMHELYIETRDSIASEENQKAVIRQEYKYAYEKQAAADSVKAAEANKVKDALLSAEVAKNEQQQQQKYFLYAGLSLALVFGGFIFNRFRVTNKQKGVIEAKKQEVDQAYDALEEKNQEIMDSIAYAKRIQTAILPPDRLIKEYLNDSFILYKPKDVVAGDFYWMEPKNGKVLFAAADCTGHGVPGAMVSVICNNGLNRATREFGLTDPGEILTKTRDLVISEFEKSEEEVKDGMDIALCSLEGNQVKFAGANNPLWIIRKGSEEVEEIKADKQPIGKYAEPKPFTSHSIELNAGDTLYTFSDGFADQFGGEKGKKFKAKNFKSLLLSIQNESMERQKELIDEAFENWRGKLEQLDDVCVIGVRV